jgi:hypothetical protein
MPQVTKTYCAGCAALEAKGLTEGPVGDIPPRFLIMLRDVPDEDQEKNGAVTKGLDDFVCEVHWAQICKAIGVRPVLGPEGDFHEVTEGEEEEEEEDDDEDVAGAS